MPALLPLSMQIGALPPGYGPLPPVGPALQPGFKTSTPPTLVQQVSSASSSAAPATFAATIAATQAGSTLVALVSITPTGAVSITGPANFTQVAAGDNAGRGMGGRLYILQGVAAGVTSVGVTGLANVNSVAIAVYELANVGAGIILQGNGSYQTFNNGASTPALAATPFASSMFWVGCEAGIAGGTFNATLTSSFLTAGAVATSTVGATNLTIRPFGGLATAQAASVSVGGTDSNNGGCLLVGLLTFESGVIALAASRALVADGGAGYGVGDTGSPGWSLGGTKPGGAGGGQ